MSWWGQQYQQGYMDAILGRHMQEDNEPYKKGYAVGNRYPSTSEEELKEWIDYLNKKTKVFDMGRALTKIEKPAMTSFKILKNRIRSPGPPIVPLPQSWIDDRDRGANPEWKQYAASILAATPRTPAPDPTKLETTVSFEAMCDNVAKRIEFGHRRAMIMHTDTPVRPEDYKLAHSLGRTDRDGNWVE